MPRSSRDQAEANRARIVEAAGKLFRSRGYEAVGIADVMKAAGMTQGGFYKHFDSKEALAVEACAAGFVSAEALWRARASGAAPVASVVDFYLSDTPAEYRCPMLAHGEETARLEADNELRRTYLDGARTLYDAFSKADREVGNSDRTKLLFAAMLGANLLRRVGQGEDWIEALATAVKREAARDRDSADVA